MFATRILNRWVVVLVWLLAIAPLLPAQDQGTPEDAVEDPETQHEKNNDVPPGGGGPGEGDPVDAATGAFAFNKKVLEIPGRGMNFSVSLQYLSSAWGVETNTGARWTHDYEQRLMIRYSWGPPPTPYDGPDKPGIGYPQRKGVAEAVQVPRRALFIDVYYIHDLFVDHFQWDPADRTNWIPTSRGFDKLKSTNVPSGPYQIPQSFVLRKPDGTKLTFPVELYEGGCGIYTVRLGSIEDRLGNTITLGYETKTKPSNCPGGEGTFYRRVNAVTDTFGRQVVFEYDTPGWLHKIRDFTNREVVLEHDTRGNVLSITSPVVSVFPPDTAASPYAATTAFSYSAFIPGNADSGHNITQVIAPTETGADPLGPGFNVPYVVNTWNSAGTHVVKQLNGGTNASGIPAGGTHYFAYDTHTPPIAFGNVQVSYRTAVVDANGYVKLHLYDDRKRLRATIRYTGALDQVALSRISFSVDGLVSMQNNELNPAIRLPAIGSQDPAVNSDVEYFEYNDNNLRTVEQTAFTRAEYTYDTAATDRSQKRNLLVSKQVSLANPEDVIVRAYAYEPLFNQLRAEWDPRAFGPYVPPNGGTLSADRYATRLFFDYQEGAQTAVQDEAAYWSIDLTQASAANALSMVGLSLAPVAFGLGDLNGDPSDTATRGNAVLSDKKVNVFQDATTAAPTYQELTVQERFQYNAFGLPVASIDPAGYRTSYTYFPHGSIAPGPDDASASANAGLIASETRAITLSGSGTVVRRLGYDAVGRVNRIKNARGAVTSLLFDELDRLVVATNAQGRTSGTLYDRNGNKIESIVEHAQPTLDATLKMPDGGWTPARYVRTSCIYDLLDNLVQKDMQIDASGATASIKYRYDKNQFRVLTLYPLWAADHANVESSVFDEFGQLWTSTKGGVTAQFAALQSTDQIPERGLIPVDVAGQTSTRRVFYELTRETRSIDEIGRETRREYDAFNRLAKTIDPLGHFAKYTVDVTGVVVKEERFGVSGAGETLLSATETLRDELGCTFEERLSHFDSEGSAIGDGAVTTRQVYDVRGHVTRLVDDNAKAWTREYDGLGRMTRDDDPLGNYSLYEYDANDNLIYTEAHEFDSDAPTTEHIYRTWSFHDELDRLTATTNTLGHTNRILYDTKGRVVFQTDARGSQVNLPLASLESAAYPQHTNLQSGPPINSDGNSAAFAYDDTDRPTATTAHQRVSGVGGGALLPGAAGEVASVKAYDLNGRPISETDDHGNATTHGYDALNRKTTTVFADLTEQRFEYFADGRLKRSRDANGTWIDYEYDGAGRLYRETATPAANVRGEVFAQFTHDGLGRLTGAVNSNSAVSRQYDSLSRVTREILNNRHTSISYDGVGTLNGYVYPGSRQVTFAYDDMQRLRAVQDQNGANTIELLEYAGRGLIKKAVLPNGTQMDVVHDAIGRATQITHTKGAAILDDRASLWDRQGNRTLRQVLTQSPALAFSYGYDSMRRMTASARSGAGQPAQNVTYQLDDLGNRTDVVGGPDAGPYTLQPPQFAVNEYTTTPVDSRSYDPNGNVTGRLSTATLYYDYRNRLVEYSDFATGRQHAYRYDALGRRIAKIVDQGTPNEKEVRYFYDGGLRVLEEQDPSGTTLATYVFDRGLDTLVSMRKDADGNGAPEDYYFHADDMDNVVALTDASGAVAERYEYGDYGVVLDPQTLQPAQSAALKSSYLFNGRELDAETGFYYFRNRYFEPDTGRFITRDPLGIWADSAGVGNGYTYSGNNPWSQRDPLGLAKEPGGAVKRPPNLKDPRSLTGRYGVLGDVNHHGSAHEKKGKSGDILSDNEYQWQKKHGYADAVLAMKDAQITELALKAAILSEAGENIGISVEKNDEGNLVITTWSEEYGVYSCEIDPTKRADLAKLQLQLNHFSRDIDKGLDYLEKTDKLAGVLFDIGINVGLAVVPVGRIAGRIAGKIPGSKWALELVGGGLKGAKLLKPIGWTGKIGEKALEALVGGTKQSFKTPLGRRVVDAYAGNVAHEAKTGVTYLTDFVKKQIAKDAWLVQNDRVKEVVWHFFESPVSGIGASQSLLDALKAAGIKYIFHRP